MAPITIPTLLFWENQNTWYGSKGNTRFFIHPLPKEEDAPHQKLEAEVWPGPLTKELSEVTAVNTFPMTEEGLAQMVAWLEEQAAQSNG